MKEKSTLEQLFKEGLNKQEFEYSEKLWQKLDTQLVPIRNEYNKKERRRILFIWGFLALLTTSGGIGYYLSSKKAVGNTDTATMTKTKASTKKETNTIVSKEALATTSTTTVTDLTKYKDLTNTTVATNNVVDATNTQVDEYNNSSLKDKGTFNKNRTKTRRAKGANRSNAQAIDKPIFNKDKDKQVIDEDVAENTPDKMEVDKLAEEVTANNNDATINDIKEKAIVPPVVKDVKEDKTIAKVTAKNKEAATSNKSSIFAIVGVNVATPIKKSGYYVGAMLEKQIDKKRRVFIGVKFAQNKLEHQLISSEKASIFPQVTDALIDRMATIQMPFGYQFKLSKAAPEKASLLSVGFEPTLLTGVRTIYYDDNGVPGGPRTVVVNSPLLKDAVNKFNLSFIVGLKLPITNSLGFTLNGGYGLIDITDKKYYNRTNSNNNLKYLQAGLLLRLR
jgi:hypothetical protein